MSDNENEESESVEVEEAKPMICEMVKQKKVRLCAVDGETLCAADGESTCVVDEETVCAKVMRLNEDGEEETDSEMEEVEVCREDTRKWICEMVKQKKVRLCAVDGETVCAADGESTCAVDEETVCAKVMRPKKKRCPMDEQTICAADGEATCVVDEETLCEVDEGEEEEETDSDMEEVEVCREDTRKWICEMVKQKKVRLCAVDGETICAADGESTCVVDEETVCAKVMRPKKKRCPVDEQTICAADGETTCVVDEETLCDVDEEEEEETDSDMEEVEVCREDTRKWICKKVKKMKLVKKTHYCPADEETVCVADGEAICAVDGETVCATQRKVRRVKKCLNGTDPVDDPVDGEEPCEQESVDESYSEMTEVETEEEICEEDTRKLITVCEQVRTVKYCPVDGETPCCADGEAICVVDGETVCAKQRKVRRVKKCVDGTQPCATDENGVCINGEEPCEQESVEESYSEMEEVCTTKMVQCMKVKIEKVKTERYCPVDSETICAADGQTACVLDEEAICARVPKPKLCPADGETICAADGEAICVVDEETVCEVKEDVFSGDSASEYEEVCVTVEEEKEEEDDEEEALRKAEEEEAALLQAAEEEAALLQAEEEAARLEAEAEAFKKSEEKRMLSGGYRPQTRTVAATGYTRTGSEVDEYFEEPSIKDQNLKISEAMPLPQIKDRYKKKINAHKNNRDNLRSKYEAARDELEANEKQFHTDEVEKSTRMADERLKLKKMDNNVKSLRAKLAAINQHNINVKNDTISLKEETAMLEESGQVTDDIRDFHALLQEKEALIEEFESNLAEYYYANKKLTEETNEDLKYIEFMQKQREPLERELERLEHHNEGQTDRVAALEKIVPILQDELEHTTERLEQLEEIVEQAHEDLTPLRKEVKQNFTKIKNTNIQIVNDTKEIEEVQLAQKQKAHALNALRNKNKGLVSTFTHQGIKTEHTLNNHHERMARLQKIYQELTDSYLWQETKSKDHLEASRMKMVALNSELEINRALTEQLLNELEDVLNEQLPLFHEILTKYATCDKIIIDTFNQMRIDDEASLCNVRVQKRLQEEKFEKLHDRCNEHIADIGNAIDKINRLSS